MEVFSHGQWNRYLLDNTSRQIVSGIVLLNWSFAGVLFALRTCWSKSFTPLWYWMIACDLPYEWIPILGSKQMRQQWIAKLETPWCIPFKHGTVSLQWTVCVGVWPGIYSCLPDSVNKYTPSKFTPSWRNQAMTKGERQHTVCLIKGEISILLPATLWINTNTNKILFYLFSNTHLMIIIITIKVVKIDKSKYDIVLCVVHWPVIFQFCPGIVQCLTPVIVCRAGVLVTRRLVTCQGWGLVVLVTHGNILTRYYSYTTRTLSRWWRNTGVVHRLGDRLDIAVTMDGTMGLL